MYLDAATNQDETKRQQDYACRDRPMGVRMLLARRRRGYDVVVHACVLACIPYER
jgi:hypothetical protein